MRGIRTRVTAVALTGAVAALAVAPGLAVAAPAGCKGRPIACIALGDLARPRPSVDPVLLNPQPLPPRHDVAGIIAALRPHLGDLVALNPQPLPPGPGDASPVALNPQPLPPHPDEASIVVHRPLGPHLGDLVAKPLRPHLGDAVALNPQPLPPGPDDASPVALNPQPLPPQPDEASLAQVQLPDVALQVGP